MSCPRFFKKAFYVATTGRPGPVLIDLPKDILTAEIDFEYPKEIKIPGYNPTMKGNIRQIKRIIETINNSRKPLIYAGGGIIASNASEELTEFVDITGIPVTLTLMGLGAFPATKPEFLGMLGMHGTKNSQLCGG